MTAVPGAAAPGREASPAGVIAAIGGIYVAQSVLGGVTFNGLPAVLRQMGLSLDQIGLILLTVVPWSFKFLWAPAVERFRLPVGRPHRSRAVVLIGGCFAAGGLAAAGLVGPTALGPLMACLVIAAFATATVDIACDGYAVESLAERHRGWGNAAQVGGAYLGAAIGGGAFLVLVDHLGWSPSAFAMAGVIVVLGLPFLLGRDGRRPAPASPDRRPNLMAALKRPEVRAGLVLVALYCAGQKWAMTLLGPYLIDQGLSLSAVGVINGVGGTAAGLAGAVLGGGLVRRFGAGPVATAAMALQLLALAGLSATALFGMRDPATLGALAIAQSGFMALGFVALYARLMGLASLTQAGVDFTLFQCMDGIVSLIGWQLAALLGERIGYAGFFALAGGVALVATAALPALFGKGGEE